jgi:hypothetical protein
MWDLIKLLFKSQKTNSSTIVTVIAVALKVLGMEDFSPEVIEIINTVIASGIGGMFIGLFHKVVKMQQAKAE